MKHPVGDIDLFYRCVDCRCYGGQGESVIGRHGSSIDIECWEHPSKTDAPYRLLLVDDVGDAIREHPVRSRDDVQGFAQQNDLAVLRSAVPEETLVHILARDARLLMDGVFAKGLARSIDVDLHIDELEAGIHLFVEEGQEGSDVLRPFIPWLYAERG